MSRKAPRHWTSRDFQSAEKWSVLKPGDIVDFIAPGSACALEDVYKAADFVRSLDLVPRFTKDIFAKKTPILSSSDEKRFAFLKQALTAPDSKAIWCLRGGYGSLRLLPELTRVNRPKRPKLLIGYSDITTLHSYVNFFWQWPSLHGPLLDRFASGRNTPRELKMMKDVLFGRRGEVEFKGLKPLNAAAKSSRKISSTVVGGTLAVLQGSLGTPWQVNPEGKILFLEDIGEKAHRVDRMLVQMSQAGYLSKAKAVVFGDIVYADDKDRKLIWKLAIEPFARECKIPVLKGLPCGHGPVQLPLPFFTPAELRLGAGASLRVKTGAAADGAE
jgi:muramoyltetrapeptide carboxypeptidase